MLCGAACLDHTTTVLSQRGTIIFDYMHIECAVAANDISLELLTHIKRTRSTSLCQAGSYRNGISASSQMAIIYRAQGVRWHQQHIRAASCGSRFESQWETPNFDPSGAKTSGLIELKIGKINYLGGLKKRANVQNYNPPGVVWAIG